MNKKEKIVLFLVMAILMTAFVCYTSISLIKTYNFSNEQYKVQINECEKVLKSEKSSEDEKEKCQTLISTTEVSDKLDFNYIFGEIMKSKFMALSYFMPIIISIPSLIWVSRLLKNKSVSNYFLRESKRNFLNRLFKETYLYIGIILYGVLLALVICLLTCNYNPMESASRGMSWWQYDTIKYLYIFIPLYLLNIFMYLGCYINVALAYLKKFHNYILAIVGSYLSIMAFELILDLVFRSNILYKLLPSVDFTFLSTINTFGFEDQNRVLPGLIFVGVCFIISLIVVIRMYGNREKLLYSNERKLS